MEVIVVVLLVIVIGLLAALFLRKSGVSSDSASLLKQDLTAMSDQVEKLRESLRLQLETQADRSNRSMSKQLEASAKLISDVTERLTKLDETNRRVVDVADELKTLQNVLQNPKQRGVLGEYYLDAVLKNVLPPGTYQMQHKFKDSEVVDAVILLDKGRLLPIDSKFSLENYNRLIEEKDKARREVLTKQFKADLKNRIDETAKYIRPRENTLDHAFMFIPSEAIYYDLLINKVGVGDTAARDLIEYAFVQKKVIIVGPTTLLAYLQTVLQGLRSLQIEEQAKDIQKKVGQLGRHIATYEDNMQRLGNSLGTTVNNFNKAHKELGKIDKDVVKIAGAEEAVEPILLEKPTIDED